MRTLTSRDIRRLRLANHWLAPRAGITAVDIVEHLGALQSQEIWSGLWSIGARSTDLDLEAVLGACEDASILRTWPLRNTVHFVPAVDTHWMLDLAESFAFKGLQRRREHLGLSEQASEDACVVLGDALAHGEPVARDECLDLLAEAGLLTDRRHGYHLLWFAAQRGVICMGPQRGSTQTFVELDTFSPEPRHLDRPAALAELARRYFTSHGPAPVTELKRWSGLGMADVRAAVAAAGDRLSEVPTEFGPMLIGADRAAALGDDPVAPPEGSRRVLLLSGFDEYVLGYGDRSAIMQPAHLKLVVPGNNGMFRPTIVDDGRVVGVWKRKATAKRVDITVEMFGRPSQRLHRDVERAAGEYGAFLGVDPRVRWTDS